MIGARTFAAAAGAGRPGLRAGLAAATVVVLALLAAPAQAQTLGALELERNRLKDAHHRADVALRPLQAEVAALASARAACLAEVRRQEAQPPGPLQTYELREAQRAASEASHRLLHAQVALDLGLQAERAARRELIPAMWAYVARLLERADQDRETRPEQTREEDATRALDDIELLEALERIDDTAGPPPPELPPVGADLPPRQLADLRELFEEAADTAAAEVAALAPDLQRLRDRVAHLERLQTQGYQIPTLAERLARARSDLAHLEQLSAELERRRHDYRERVQRIERLLDERALSAPEPPGVVR